MQGKIFTLISLLTLLLFSTSNINAQTWAQLGADIDGTVEERRSGTSVSLSADGSTLAVGAPYSGGNVNAGYVFFYEWTGTAWAEKGVRIQGLNYSTTGYSLQLSADGNTVVIGARSYNADAGQVLVYEWDGTEWLQKGLSIDGEAPDILLGTSVGISADGLTIAASSPASTDGGSVRMYEWDGAAWTQKGITLNGDTPLDYFGKSISLSTDGNTLAVGAPNKDSIYESDGQVKVFQWNGAAWIPKGTDILASFETELFGTSVALSADGNSFVAGAIFGHLPSNPNSQGIVRAYQWNGTSWQQKGTDLYGTSFGSRFGFAVSMNADGSRFAVGAPYENIGITSSGEVRMYKWDGTAWAQEASIGGEAGSDNSGWSISMSTDGATVAAGAPLNDDGEYRAGHVRVYGVSCLPTSSTDIINTCDSHTWIDGMTYTESNNSATVTLTNDAGCDSLITLDLTVTSSETYTDIITACDSYIWTDGNTYTTSNTTATQSLMTAAGCDSLVTLNLTINSSNSATDVITACGNYTWIDGNTYTASNNTAMHTLMNAAGCDSIVTLDLTIGNDIMTTDIITACDSYTWTDGNTYLTSNTTAMQSLMTTDGCDSIVTLDLTINSSNSATDVITSCGNYTWIDGNTYAASNNTATHTLMNTAGCDSLVTLDLTIGNTLMTTDVITACDSYTWTDGNTYLASNNTAMQTLMTTDGCDSIVTLDLTVNYSAATTDVITSCGTYTWIDGNTYASDNNTATYTIMTTEGCDSTVTLDLTVNTVDVSLIINPPTLTANASNATYQWVDCDNAYAPLAGETNQIFTATENGSYAAIVTQNSCVDTSSCVLVLNVGLGENLGNHPISIFPNPTTSRLNIELGAAYEEVKVGLRNTLGQLVLTKDVGQQQNFFLELDVEKGLYFLEIASGAKLLTTVKVMKQ